MKKVWERRRVGWGIIGWSDDYLGVDEENMKKVIKTGNKETLG